MKNEKIIVIGGSAGSMSVLIQLIDGLPAGFTYPIIIIIHRLKNVKSEMDKLLCLNYKGKVCEPEDKAEIENHHIYLAPQNYHLLIEEDESFSLDYSEPVFYCRPSIDVTFESASVIYGSSVTGILLSGSNKDGAAGLNSIIKKGGTGIVQHPNSSEYQAMPQAAINKNESVKILTPPQIINYLQQYIVRESNI